jgi:nitric oxide synthase-interacting protein
LAQKKQIDKEGQLVQSHNATVETDEQRKKRLEDEKKKQQFIAHESQVLSTIRLEKIDQTSTAFWLPYMAPTAEVGELKVSKTSPQCPGPKGHSISIKKLTKVVFSKQDKGGSICPVCVKTLKNGIKIEIMKPCGHVVCHSCTQKFLKDTKKCPTCEQAVKDTIRLEMEGTGFAAGGKAEVVKETVPFM